MAKGIRERHSRSCRLPSGGRCGCEPSFEAHVWNPAIGRQHKRTFRNRAEAQNWIRDTKIALRRGRKIERPTHTLQATCDAWLEQASQGVIRTRSGDTYKPAALRAYATAFRRRVYPVLGSEPVADVGRADLQELVDRLVAEGLSASTIHTPITALKAVFRHELDRDRIKVNPTVGLRLPAVRGGRDRIADPQEAERLLAVLSEADRPIWATAFYGGLRRGELRALRVQAIDLEANEINVVAGWDDQEGEQATKGRERRKVPLIPTLRAILREHLLRTGRRGTDLVFGESAASPFDPKKLTKRADEAWRGLDRITLHECRHTFASIAIAAEVNIGTVSTAMGHASVKVTWDRYHHLMPGTMDEAAELIQAYIDRPTVTAS